MPSSKSRKSLRRARLKQSLCIVDTCSLVYLNNIELARKPLQKWLWEEFEIKYSEVILNEFWSFRKKVSFRENWEDYVWRFPSMEAYERAVFSLHQKKVSRYCSHCGQISWEYKPFIPNLTEDKDKGERHNCCLTLYAVLEGDYSQIIFLTDDLQAIRDYATYFFDLFPLGSIWSLLDFIIYLFIRYHKNISLEDTKNALRDVNTGPYTAQANDEESQDDVRNKESSKKRRRLMTYYNKAERIFRIFSQM